MRAGQRFSQAVAAKRAEKAVRIYRRKAVIKEINYE